MDHQATYFFFDFVDSGLNFMQELTALVVGTMRSYIDVTVCCDVAILVVVVSLQGFQLEEHFGQVGRNVCTE